MKTTPITPDMHLMAELRHQQLRAEIFGWAALIIALVLFKAELLIPGPTTFPDFGLLVLAVVSTVVAFRDSWLTGRKMADVRQLQARTEVSLDSRQLDLPFSN
jgi:hypothetical protein